jgi:hypothetical protein
VTLCLIPGYRRTAGNPGVTFTFFQGWQQFDIRQTGKTGIVNQAGKRVIRFANYPPSGKLLSISGAGT